MPGSIPARLILNHPARESFLYKVCQVLREAQGIDNPEFPENKIFPNTLYLKQRKDNVANGKEDHRRSQRGHRAFCREAKSENEPPHHRDRALYKKINQEMISSANDACTINP